MAILQSSPQLSGLDTLQHPQSRYALIHLQQTNRSNSVLGKEGKPLLANRSLKYSESVCYKSNPALDQFTLMSIRAILIYEYRNGIQ